MAEKEYNWPVGGLRDGMRTAGATGPAEFVFPSTTPTGAVPVLDPSSLASRSKAAALLDDNPARKTTIIVTSIVAVVALVSAGGFFVLRHQDSAQTAFDSCQQSVSIYQQSTDRLKKTVESAQPSTKVAASAVDDPATLKTLQKAIDDTQHVEQITNTCNASAGAAQNRTADEQITKQTRTIGAKNENVSDASDAVMTSKATKEAKDARAALQDKLQQTQTFSNTEAASKADPVTRSQLSDALAQAQQLLSTSQIMSASVYQNAAQALQAGADKVNQSALG